MRTRSSLRAPSVEICGHELQPHSTSVVSARPSAALVVLILPEADMDPRGLGIAKTCVEPFFGKDGPAQFK